MPLYTVTGVTPIMAGDAVRISFESDESGENTVKTIGAEQYAALREQGMTLEKGVQIDAFGVKELEEAEQLYRAIKTGVAIITRGDTSVADMTRRLIRRGYSSSCARAAAAYLDERGYIDEDEQIGRVAMRLAERGYGRSKIAAELMRRGYGRTAINETLSQIAESFDFVASCADTIRRRYGDPPYTKEDSARIYASMRRTGHVHSDIVAALRRVEAREDD